MKHIDRTCIGALAGIVGGLVLIAYYLLMGLFLPAAPKIIMSIGTLFFSISQVNTLLGQIIAYTAHLTVSALLGILFINFFRITGRDWVITKGIIFGVAVWMILSGVAVHLLGLIPKKPSVSLAMVVLTSHLIFGLVISISASILSNKAKL